METAEEPQSCSRVIIFTWKIAGVNLRESLALPPHPTAPLPAAAAELVFRGKNICRNISSKFETLLSLSYSELLSAESRDRSVTSAALNPGSFLCAASFLLQLGHVLTDRHIQVSICRLQPLGCSSEIMLGYISNCGLKLNLSVNKQTAGESQRWRR